jgi:hypothetical protein
MLASSQNRSCANTQTAARTRVSVAFLRRKYRNPRSGCCCCCCCCCWALEEDDETDEGADDAAGDEEEEAEEADEETVETPAILLLLALPTAASRAASRLAIRAPGSRAGKLGAETAEVKVDPKRHFCK